MRSQRAITDAPEKPGVDQGLAHHRNNAEQHGHGHRDEVFSDRPLCELGPL